MQRLGEVFRTPGLLKQYEAQYLTHQELAEQKKKAEEA
jgi:hypothetical protein